MAFSLGELVIIRQSASVAILILITFYEIKAIVNPICYKSQIGNILNELYSGRESEETEVLMA